MRSITILFAALFYNQLSICQSIINNELNNLISQSDAQDFVKIRIEFKAQVSEEKDRWVQTSLSLHQRTVYLIDLMRSTASNSQNMVLKYLNQHPEFVRNIQSFWISNVVFCEIRANAIQELNTFEDIEQVYFENNHFQLGDVVTEQSCNENERVIGGTEPGIEACNVRPLWEMGYTGRGRKVFVYDTGVWPTHPAISERFMGNHTFLNESWYGYYHFEPNGERNSHGTHVLGTMLGLEVNTADSIGIAMNSYWIANDHVGPTISVMPDLPYLMAAYEWALNPDGDFSTTHDIPDVINNSFRWYDGANMEQCEGIVVDLMTAIEAAGIVNIYSGGNQGPSNTTISAPQRINISPINTFSVGSVNGNLPFPHPLSAFSSLGPKQCPGEGSLAIHPEVVAPGQNVRSASGQSSYSVLSGTSMASPHVSGVALLLKEAFPNLSGEDILWAIYLTAIDIGPEGEDNQFGMGMIDAYAAYLYLAETNTSSNPNEVLFDLSVESINGIEMNGVYCENIFNPSITIKNNGLSTIQSFSLTYNWIGGANTELIWSEPITPGASVMIDIPTLTTDFSGFQEFWVEAKITDEQESYDLVNNKRHVRWNVRRNEELPYIEEFENGWNNGAWIVENPDESYTWRTTQAPFHHSDNHAAVIQLTNYSPSTNQRDALISPIFALSTSGEFILDFDICYRKKSNISSHFDTLFVFIQFDCDGTKDTIATLFGNELAYTTSAWPNFIPESAEHWKHFEFILNDYVNQEISVVFESVNRAGNHIYLDNFKIYEFNNPPVEIVDLLLPEFFVYPNPVLNKFAISLNNVQFYEPLNLEISNMMGQTIKNETIHQTNQIIDVSDFSSGIYFVSILVNGNKLMQRFVIE